MLSRQFGQNGIALVVLRQPMMSEFHRHSLRPETLDQIPQGIRRCFATTRRQGLPHMTFPAPGQDLPVPTGRFGQHVVVVLQFALLAARQMRGSDLPRKPAIPFLPTGKHQEVCSTGICRAGSGYRIQRQLGPEHGAHSPFTCGFRKPHHAVEAVVIGDGDSFEPETHCFLDQLFRR